MTKQELRAHLIASRNAIPREERTEKDAKIAEIETALDAVTKEKNDQLSAVQAALLETTGEKDAKIAELEDNLTAATEELNSKLAEAETALNAVTKDKMIRSLQPSRLCWKRHRKKTNSSRKLKLPWPRSSKRRMRRSRKYRMRCRQLPKRKMKNLQKQKQIFRQ